MSIVFMGEAVDGGLKIDDGIEDAVHEPLLLVPHARIGHAGLGHHRRNAKILSAHKHDTRPPNVLLWAFGVSDDRAQSLTIAGQYGE